MITSRELAEQVDEDLSRGALDRAFNRVISYAEEACADAGSVVFVLGSPTLDALCRRLGEELAVAPPAAFDRRAVVYLASGFTFPEGIAFSLRHLIEAQPDRRHLVLLSGAAGSPGLAEARRFFGPGVEVEAAPAGPVATAARWVSERLAAAAPGRAFLLCRPYDAAAVAAFRPGLAGEMLFCHHLDYRLTLGVHLRGVRHVDFRHSAFVHCRHSLGIGDNLYLPLTAGKAVNGPAPALPLTTATSGSVGEFALAYEVRLAEEVPRWMAATGGRHLHVGSLPGEVTAKVEAALAFSGIPKDRFTHRPAVDSLRAVLLEEAAGLYIDSFPVGSPRSVVEAMSAGIPVVTHHHPTSLLLSDETLAYRGAFSWNDPDDLVERLAGLTDADLAVERALAAEHYGRHHDPGHLAGALAGERVSEVPAPERSYPVATLRAFQRERGRRGQADFSTRLGWLVIQALGLPTHSGERDRALLSAVLYDLSTQDAAGWGERALLARRNLLLGLTDWEEIAGAYARLDYAELSEHLFRRERLSAVARKGGRWADTTTEETAIDPGAPAEVTIAADRLARLRRADQDLRRLLRRLGSGPSGWLLRRFPVFRKLERRYLGTDRP
ncbi:MAG: hypothetical protein FJW79_05680 [Actinobacteria bacterium]|nr:hypothetical protein [Actinomycetota bacterium]